MCPSLSDSAFPVTDVQTEVCVGVRLARDFTSEFSV